MGSVSEDKVAIVSGAVVSIGEALLRTLLGKGWKVGALDLDDNLGSALEKEFPEKVIYIRCDMSSYDQQAVAFTQVFKKWGRIDAFCSNAGASENSQIYKLDYRGKDTIPPEPNCLPTRVSFFGFLYDVQLSIHFMRQNPTPGGAIVGTSSSLSTHPTPSMPEHAAAKAAMNVFTRSSAPFLKSQENITINTVLPGMVPTRNIPSQMREIFDGYLTPVDTIITAYLRLLEDPSLYGQNLDTFRNEIVALPEQPWIHPDVVKTTEVWEGQFLAFHGQPSCLPNTHPFRS
ncbi:hypothetical protein BKA61DRAFT_741132 [Leptodontidium sp. MPI-SDFR-AT-0119]|nr:hypothetical protein BKA61DRAFT_741132 [Leptodontidium sp. MPI-SDFR-AT-0119]